MNITHFFLTNNKIVKKSKLSLSKLLNLIKASHQDATSQTQAYVQNISKISQTPISKPMFAIM
jgi:hypothetical protein